MTDIYLMKAEIDLENMARWAAEEKHSDPDRTAHCLLAESFGLKTAPRPFVIKADQEGGGRTGLLLAYARQDTKELRGAADRNQKLAHAAVLNPMGIETVAVPSRWAQGQKLRFEIRVRPTKRSSERDEGGYKEQDYFIMAPEGSSRAEIYCQWLGARMEGQGALSADPGDMTVTSMSLRKVRRQAGSGWHTGPDVTIAGTATVEAPELMETAIGEGLGRYRSYGYGMLLLQNGAR